MVQFKLSANSPHADYWKLDRPQCSAVELKRRFGISWFYFKSSANKSRLLTLLSRNQRGLLSYDKYTVQQLRAWCNQRGITVHEASKKEDCVTILEAADDNPSFSRFLNLPPELRNLIYTAHFATFPGICLPNTPPVTEVSHQLRQETRDLFYQSCKVTIALSFSNQRLIHVDPLLWSRLPHGRLIQLSESTERIFPHLPQEYLGLQQRFQIDGAVHLNPTECARVRWTVDIGAGRRPVYVSGGPWKGGPKPIPKEFVAGRKAVSKVMRKKLWAIMRREGRIKLQRQDCKLFRRMFAP